MGVLALKLFLAPSFVIGTSLVVRRHGALVGGIVGGLPVVAGPILIVLAVVHGKHFGAEASSACLLGMVSLTAFAVAYARLAPRTPWPVALVLGWCVFAVSTAILATFTASPGPLVGMLAGFASFAIGMVALPEASASDAEQAHPRWDLPMRGIAAAAMVVTLTALSSSLGAELSGLVAPFPVITSVLAAFTHAQRGHDDAAVLLRGMLGGFFVYALLVFGFALALGAQI